jgi:hypothetical protein
MNGKRLESEHRADRERQATWQSHPYERGAQNEQ